MRPEEGPPSKFENDSKTIGNTAKDVVNTAAVVTAINDRDKDDCAFVSCPNCAPESGKSQGHKGRHKM
jgi:hypothetical protein